MALRWKERMEKDSRDSVEPKSEDVDEVKEKEEKIKKTMKVKEVSRECEQLNQGQTIEDEQPTIVLKWTLSSYLVVEAGGHRDRLPHGWHRLQSFVLPRALRGGEHELLQ